MLSHPRTAKLFPQNILKQLLLGVLVTTPLTANAMPLSPNDSFKLKVEPLNWWAGMKNPQLQLMVHGQSIADSKVSVEAKQVKVLGVQHSDNSNYLFIDLDTTNAPAQAFSITLTNIDGSKHTFAYQLKAREPGSEQRQGFSNKDAIYLITPDRFANGDPNNDNHPNMLELANRADKDGRHGGDIKGIIDNLDYLEDLGITQLWINPLTENNQPQYSYHGYSVTDHYQIDPRYGTNEDYRQLSLRARNKGIGIIADVVVNHIGSNHWWMKDLPSSDWINKPLTADSPTANIQFTSHRRTTVQDPYAVSSDTKAFTDGWFVDSMPDLNQRNPLLATYLIQNSLWWIEHAGLSGIREDTYSYADKGFLVKWAKAIMDEYPDFNIVGEEWTANPITVSYWQKGKHNQDGYQSELPSLMDFPLYETLISALNEPEGWDTGFIKLYEFLGNDVVYADPTQLVLFEGNHDTNRLYSLLGDDIALTQMAMAYVLTSNRIPQLLYGTEILMQSPTKDRNDGAVRADMPGGWQNDAISAFDSKGLMQSQSAMQQFTKQLLNYRRTSSAIIDGGLRHLVPQDGVYLQVRCEDKACAKGASLLVIYNKNQTPTEVDLARLGELINTSATGYNIITQAPQPLDQAIVLAGKGVTLIDLTGKR
ncbi:glycoside hydrolase family 13 protein [Shewanella mesophila]|uniref:glycoside hydrolase family 13 protein n=1 Tax=Shewanella mesophila TaxID=2864208 RepID=UPI001C659370|nr:glycoside hydrolase family 13 protein [Shewanella mesophila]QYJ84588.1 glycoside hydrolase family 13 protein [Shewanella mesophila]